MWRARAQLVASRAQAVLEGSHAAGGGLTRPLRRSAKPQHAPLAAGAPPLHATFGRCTLSTLDGAATWDPARATFQVPHAPASTELSPASGLASIGDVIQGLRAVAADDGTRATDLLPYTERGAALAVSSSLEAVTDLAECYAELRLQTALRDLLPIIIARVEDLRPGAEFLNSAIRILEATGRSSLFAQEVFQFCAVHLGQMDRPQLVTYLYEAGRHGLRCRHFIDAALPTVTHVAPQMNLDETMQATQAMMRFSRDWSAFFMAARPTMLASLGDMTNKQLLLSFRIARDLRFLDQEQFIDLHTACASELSTRANMLSPNEAAQALSYANFFHKFKPQVQLLVRALDMRLHKEEDLRSLRVAEAVDALLCFGSWDFRAGPLVDRLDTLLCERGVELKYAGNVALWVNATEALAKLDRIGGHWPYIALEYSRQKHFLERISHHQLRNLITAFVRLRIFDEVVYQHIAELLMADMVLFKEASDLASVLLAYTNAGHYLPELFDAAYDWMIEKLEEESLDLTRLRTQSAVSTIAWCLASAGYHVRYESFAAMLDYAFHTPLDVQRGAAIRRLVGLAEVAVSEAPDAVAKSQYADRIHGMRSDLVVRRVLSSQQRSEMALVQNIRAAMQQLGWRHNAFESPDSNVAAYVDISLEPHFGRKIGILVAGPKDAFSDGLPIERRPARESGRLSQTKRMLAASDWASIVVRREEWERLGTSSARCAFLEASVEELLQERA